MANRTADRERTIQNAYETARGSTDVKARLRARAVILAHSAGMGELARQLEMAEALADLCLVAGAEAQTGDRT